MPDDEEVDEVVTQLLTLVEPVATPPAGTTPEEREAMGRAIANRTSLLCDEMVQSGYSRAELLLVRRRLPRDPKAGHNYGRGFSLADAERIVQEHRQMRRQLTSLVSAAERDALLAAHADLDPARFYHSGKFRAVGGGRDAEPLYRYREDVPEATLALPTATVHQLPPAR